MAALELRLLGRAKPKPNQHTALDNFVARTYSSREPNPDLLRVMKAYQDTQQKGQRR